MLRAPWIYHRNRQAVQAQSSKCGAFVIPCSLEQDSFKHQARKLREQLFDSFMVIADAKFQRCLVNVDVQVPLRHVYSYVHELTPICGGCDRPPWLILPCRSIRARAPPAVRILQVWPKPQRLWLSVGLRDLGAFGLPRHSLFLLQRRPVLNPADSGGFLGGSLLHSSRHTRRVLSQSKARSAQRPPAERGQT